MRSEAVNGTGSACSRDRAVLRAATPIAAVALAALAVYAVSLLNGFVYDDASQVVANPWIRSIRHVPDLFSNGVWMFEGTASNYYRPLMSVLYLATNLVFGMEPWAFHLVNVLLHAGASVLVFLISARLLGRAPDAGAGPSWIAPLAAALIFAVHPVQTEAVAWVAGLPDVAFTFFGLLSLYCFILVREGSGGRALSAASVAAFAFALLFKETAVIVPLVLLSFDLAYGAEPRRGRLADYLPYGLVLSVYLVIRIIALGGIAPVRRLAGLGVFRQLLNVPPLFMDYVGTLLLPLRLNAYHAFHPVTSLAEPRTVLALAVAAAYAGTLALLFRRNRTAFFALLLMLLPLVPVMYIAGVGENAFAERYLYLPTFGMALFLTAVVPPVAWQRRYRRSAAVLAVLFVLLSAGTVRRIMVWKNDVTLWTDTAAKSPESLVPQAALGYALLNAGALDEAVSRLQGVLLRKPDFFEARYNLGLAFGKLGRNSEAIDQLQFASDLRPGNAAVHRDLARILQRSGSIARAIEHFQAVVGLDQRSASARNDLAMAYGEQGLTARAVEEFRSALAIEPENANIHYNLGLAYRDQGLLDPAIRQFQAAMDLAPGDQEIRFAMMTAREQKAAQGRTTPGRSGLAGR